MDFDEILDHLLVPRPNGSANLAETAAFLEATLRRHAPLVELQAFGATTHGFQILFATALALMLAAAGAVLLQRHAAGLLLIASAAVLLVLEAEYLHSPVSGLVTATEHNVIATFPGAASGPRLILAAHYDTATHFGDHVAWSRWGPAMGPGVAVSALLAATGLARRRRGRRLPGSLAVPLLAAALLPFLMMAWFFSAGPLLRAPSPGALDNGGSVAVLLRLAERLASRPAHAPTTVELAFFAAEEERALGSWWYAKTIEPGSRVAVVNLETLGTPEPIGYVPEEGFQLRRYRPDARLLRSLDEVFRTTSGESIQPVAFPRAALTDARSFLQRGIPAVTLLGHSAGVLPRDLHSQRDDRSRLSVAALEDAVDLLAALIAHLDRKPRW